LCNILLVPGAGRNQVGRAKEPQVLADMSYARGVLKQKMIVHLAARRGLGATDPRDMIFAHMFLAADTNTLLRYVQVDYIKSCAAVYEDAARFLLEEVGPEGPVKFFPNAVKDQTSKIDGLASWAPDCRCWGRNSVSYSRLSHQVLPRYCPSSPETMCIEQLLTPPVTRESPLFGSCAYVQRKPH
jgi:hypothetical protein